MENTIKIFTYNNTNKVRTVEKDGEAWFVAKDVAKALGYKDTSDALKKHVDKEDKLTRRIADSGQMREVFIINEPGVYSLIFSSKLPSAKQFKHWVTHEVLPDIRKHGMYISDKVLSKSPEEFDKIFRLYAEEKNKVKALTEQIDNDRAYTTLGKIVADMPGAFTIQEASDFLLQHGITDKGCYNLYKALRNMGLLSRQKGHWNKPTRKGIDKGVAFLALDRGEYRLSTRTVLTAKGLKDILSMFFEEQYPLIALIEKQPDPENEVVQSE